MAVARAMSQEPTELSKASKTHAQKRLQTGGKMVSKKSLKGMPKKTSRVHAKPGKGELSDEDMEEEDEDADECGEGEEYEAEDRFPATTDHDRVRVGEAPVRVGEAGRGLGKGMGKGGKLMKPGKGKGMSRMEDGEGKEGVEAPAKTGPGSKGKRKSKARSTRDWSSYVRKIFYVGEREASDKLRIKPTSVLALNSLVNDIIDRIGVECNNLCRYAKTGKLRTRDVRTAMSFVTNHSEIGKNMNIAGRDAIEKLTHRNKRQIATAA